MVLRSCWREFRAPCTTLHRAMASHESMEIFDGLLKAKQRDRASFYPVEPDPLVDEVADRLMERMLDCTREFKRALVLGGSGWQILHNMHIHCLQRSLSSGPGLSSIEKVTVMDTSPGMLKRAETNWNNLNLKKFNNLDKKNIEKDVQNLAENKSKGNGMKVDFILADAETEILPVEPNSFDVVVSCLGLHWVNDVPGVMYQCQKALRPDGLFLAAMLGGATLQELRIACSVAQQEREGGVSPRTSPLAQVRDAGNLLTRAGLRIPTVDVDDIEVSYRDPLALVRHLRRMGENNALLQRQEELSRDSALASAAAYIALFGDESNHLSALANRQDIVSEIENNTNQLSDETNPIPATFQVIYMTGWSPDPSQQKAAKRGSATASFKDISEAMEGKKSE